MQRVAVKGVAVGQLDHPAEVHDGHSIGDVFHDRQVVGNEQKRQMELGLELLEEIEHLRLYRDVQCGHRLVGDHEVRLEDQRPCDPDPLPLPPGELMWVAAGVVPFQTHQLQHVADPLVAFTLVGHSVELESFGDGIPHLGSRVK